MIKEVRLTLKSSWWAISEVRKAIGIFSIIISFLLVVLGGVLPTITSIGLSQIIEGLNNSDLAAIVFAFWLFVLPNLLSEFTTGLDGLLDGVIWRRTEKHVVFKFINHLSLLDNYTLESPNHTDAVNKAQESYSYRVQNSFSYIFGFLSSFISLVSILLTFITIYGWVVLLIVVAVLPKVYVNLKFSKRTYSIWDGDTTIRKKYYKLSNYLTDVSNKTELRLTNSVEYLIKLKQELFTSFFNNTAKVALKRDIYSILTSLISFLGVTIIIILGLISTIKGEMTIGSFSLVTSLSLSLVSSLQRFFSNLVRIQDNSQYVRSLMYFFNLKPVILFGNEVLNQDLPLSIEFKNLSFTYPNSTIPSLNNINLIINPGEKIAIVGENGAGKSTLIKLLTRQYLPTSGEILINNVPIEEYTQDSLYSAIGSLQQNFAHFEFLTVKDNIGIGNPKDINNLERIIQSAKLSGADKVIEKLELGYNQVLAKDLPNGTDISGGEWQRIAIARTFFKNSSLIILDEPTSAIDPVSESELFENIYLEVKNKTVIIISHRFSTVKNADRILVLHDGKIIEDGTHNALIAHKGMYAKAFNLQAKAFTDGNTVTT